MKIIDFKTFMLYPKGTVFVQFFGDDPFPTQVKIKDTNCEDYDFYAERLYDQHYEIDKAGKEYIYLDFNACGRDGMMNEEQMFGVFDKNELISIVGRLLLSLSEGY